MSIKISQFQPTGTILDPDTYTIISGGVNKNISHDNLKNNGFISPEFIKGWDADSNVPALSSGVGINDALFLVTKPGATVIDGNTDWMVGEAAYFNSASSMWEKVVSPVSTIYNSDGVILSDREVDAGDKSFEIKNDDGASILMDSDGIRLEGNPLVSDSLRVGDGVLNPSEILGINSTTQGVRSPSMLAAERDIIGGPSNGLQVFSSDIEKQSIYTSSGWEDFVSLPEDSFEYFQLSVTEMYNTGGSKVYIGGIVATLSFLNGQQNSMYYNWTVPQNCVNKTMEVQLYWAPNNDNSGDVLWDVTLTDLVPGDVLPGSESSYTVASSAPGTEDELVKATLAIPGYDGSSSPNLVVPIKISRLGNQGGDTYTSSARLLKVVIKYFVS